MDSLEERLANDVRIEYLSNVSFEQFNESYSYYKKHIQQKFNNNERVDLPLKCHIESLYQKRIGDEKRL